MYDTLKSALGVACTMLAVLILGAFTMANAPTTTTAAEQATASHTMHAPISHAGSVVTPLYDEEVNVLVPQSSLSTCSMVPGSLATLLDEDDLCGFETVDTGFGECAFCATGGSGTNCFGGGPGCGGLSPICLIRTE